MRSVLLPQVSAILFFHFPLIFIKQYEKNVIKYWDFNAAMPIFQTKYYPKAQWMRSNHGCPIYSWAVTSTCGHHSTRDMRVPKCPSECPMEAPAMRYLSNWAQKIQPAAVCRTGVPSVGSWLLAVSCCLNSVVLWCQCMSVWFPDCQMHENWGFPLCAHPLGLHFWS